MKQLIFTFSFLLFLASAFSQRVNDIVPSRTSFNDSIKGKLPNHVVQLHGEGYYQSSDLKNEFTDYFFKGGFIDSTLKTEALNQLKAENRIGAEINYGVNYYNYHSQFFGKPHWGWCGGISNTEYYSGKFSKNLFELAFFGNKNFAGDTVQLAPFSFSQLRFQKLSLGAFNKENFSSLSLSFIHAEDFFSVSSGNAQLYTESTGSQIDLRLDETVSRSDTSNKGFGSMNGYGFATDLVIYLNNGKNRNVRFGNPFKVSLENFGFIHWNNQSLKQQKDTSYHYEGFEVTNILNGGTSPFSQTTLNDTVNVRYQKKEFNQWLPFTFTVSKITNAFAEDKLQGYYGVRLRAFANYKPMVFAGLQYRACDFGGVSAYASFGGYGGFRLGMQLYSKIGKHFQASINSSNLIGWFSKNGYGKDAGINLYMLF